MLLPRSGYRTNISCPPFKRLSQTTAQRCWLSRVVSAGSSWTSQPGGCQRRVIGIRFAIRPLRREKVADSILTSILGQLATLRDSQEPNLRFSRINASGGGQGRDRGGAWHDLS